MKRDDKSKSPDDGTSDDSYGKALVDDEIIRQKYHQINSQSDNSNQILATRSDREGGSGVATRDGITHITNRGVINSQILSTDRENKIRRYFDRIKPVINGPITLGLHWMTLTTYCDVYKASGTATEAFYELFGDLAKLGKGRQGFRELLGGKLGFTIAYIPTQPSKRGPYCSVNFPGAACEAIDPAEWLAYAGLLRDEGITHHCTRLDFKFDNAPFSPHQFRYMLAHKLERLTANHDSIRHIINDEPNEIGEPGSMTVYVGSNNSERQICVYDYHGYTRFEMRTRGKRAEALYVRLMTTDAGGWNDLLLGVIQDYLSIDDPRWRKFIQTSDRAYMRIGHDPNRTLNDLKRAAINQWSAAYSILHDIDPEFMKTMLKTGRERRSENKRYAQILHEYDLHD